MHLRACKFQLLTWMKASGFGQPCLFDNLRVHSAAVWPSLRATALKNSSKLIWSLLESSAVMPTSRKMTWGFDFKIFLWDRLLRVRRTRMFPGCISAWTKLSTWKNKKGSQQSELSMLIISFINSRSTCLFTTLHS